MKNKGFTLIELLAVIVILAIIALIATPIILGIIKDSKEESDKRSIEGYASALKNAIAQQQIANPNEVVSGKFTTTDGNVLTGNTTLTVEYDGNVVCDRIDVYSDGNIYLEQCKVNGDEVEYTYGKEASFAEDDWSTIIANIKAGYLYNVGDTKEVKLTGFTNTENENGTFTVRIANNSTPEECSTEGFSQTACGFVIEFVDIITTHNMNSTNINIGGWRDSAMREYVTPVEGKENSGTIYNALPEKIRNSIISTTVVSGHGSSIVESNFTTTDKLYLLSTQEVWGSNLDGDTANDVTRQLDYYKNYKNENGSIGVTLSNYSGAIKTHDGNAYNWWLRSTHSTFYFFQVYSNGGSRNDFSAAANGVAPAFRLSE